VIDALRRVLEADSRVAYALLFGSHARGSAHAHSDVDVAIGLHDGVRLDTLESGELTARLETAAGRPVHVVMLADAPPGLAYRVFREGRVIVVHDEQARNARLARAILEYLDFRPIEQEFTRGVLRAGGGR
jgi:predicted nucleotidyltransferase